MTLRQYVKENRQYIDYVIEKRIGYTHYPINDSDRIEWVNNDETLYIMAIEEGVNI